MTGGPSQGLPSSPALRVPARAVVWDWTMIKTQKGEDHTSSGVTQVIGTCSSAEDMRSFQKGKGLGP